MITSRSGRGPTRDISPIKNVKQLGKLIQMQVTQNMAYRCDTGIMLGRKTCPVLLGIHTHASEFPDAELLSLIG